MKTQTNTGYIVFLSVVAAIGGILFGYDTAVISGTIAGVATQFGLDAMQQGWFVGCALVGSIAGVAVAGVMSDRFGRKRTMLVSAVLFTVSAVGCALCADFQQLILYRIIGGVGIGVVSIVSPMYISEVAVARWRGSLVSLYQLAITVGFLAAYLVNFGILRSAETAHYASETMQRIWITERWRGMFGAETLPMDRAADRRVFDGTVSLINDFKRYFRRFDQPIYENPSPGNKKGGITTLEEKSLGCVQKGGAQPVVDVLIYAQPVTKPGLNLLQAPGNDLVAASALALSGCQLVLFTTGRGTPFGSFVPTMKISTNTQLAEFKANWIDFNAGTLVEDEEPQAVLERFIGKVLATAGGERLKHEETGFKEIAIFKTGVTL